MATLAEVKKKLFGDENYSLTLNYSEDENGNQDTTWLRHWNNDKRIAVSIPADVMPHIKGSNNIIIQTEQRSTDKGTYIAHRLLVPDANAVEVI